MICYAGNRGGYPYPVTWDDTCHSNPVPQLGPFQSGRIIRPKVPFTTDVWCLAARTTCDICREKSVSRPLHQVMILLSSLQNVETAEQSCPGGQHGICVHRFFTVYRDRITLDQLPRLPHGNLTSGRNCHAAFNQKIS